MAAPDTRLPPNMAKARPWTRPERSGAALGRVWRCGAVDLGDDVEAVD